MVNQEICQMQRQCIASASTMVSFVFLSESAIARSCSTVAFLLLQDCISNEDAVVQLCKDP